MFFSPVRDCYGGEIPILEFTLPPAFPAGDATEIPLENLDENAVVTPSRLAK
jgi:hypothetical protein